MSVKILNDTANGSVTLKGQNVAGDVTHTLPEFTTELAPRMQLMTAQNSTSGTSIDFTGIPSWAKKITVMFNGVITNGTSHNLVQVGSTTFLTSGYLHYHSIVAGGLSPSTGATTTGFGIWHGAAAETTYLLFTLENITGNTWVASFSGGSNNGTTYYTLVGGGSISLAGTLDRIRVTTVNGTDTFDAGSINIMYEG